MPEAVGVFHDSNRHTCIRVSVERKYTKFIPLSVTEIRIRSMLNSEFEETYKELPDYPVQRAAERYLFNGDGVTPEITPEAKALLRAMAGPAHKREKMPTEAPKKHVSPTQPKEEPKMTEETKKAPAKRPAKAAKAAVTKGNGKKPAAKKAAKKEASEGGRGRAPNIAGTAKIKLLTKENPKRAAAAERFALYKNGMTVDEYISAGGKRADVNWDVGQSFIEVR